MYAYMERVNAPIKQDVYGSNNNQPVSPLKSSAGKQSLSKSPNKSEKTLSSTKKKSSVKLKSNYKPTQFDQNIRPSGDEDIVNLNIEHGDISNDPYNQKNNQTDQLLANRFEQMDQSYTLKESFNNKSPQPKLKNKATLPKAESNVEVVNPMEVISQAQSVARKSSKSATKKKKKTKASSPGIKGLSQSFIQKDEFQGGLLKASYKRPTTPIRGGMDAESADTYPPVEEQSGDDDNIYYNMKNSLAAGVEEAVKKMFKKKSGKKLDVLELGSYIKKKSKGSPKKLKTAKKKDNITEYKTEKEKMKEAIKTLLKSKVVKAQQKNVNRLYKGAATKQYVVAPPEPPKKKKVSVKKKKKATKTNLKYNNESGDNSENRDLIDLYTPFENLMSNYKVS